MGPSPLRHGGSSGAPSGWLLSKWHKSKFLEIYQVSWKLGWQPNKTRWISWGIQRATCEQHMAWFHGLFGCHHAACTLICRAIGSVMGPESQRSLCSPNPVVYHHVPIKLAIECKNGVYTPCSLHFNRKLWLLDMSECKKEQVNQPRSWWLNLGVHVQAIHGTPVTSTWPSKQIW